LQSFFLCASIGKEKSVKSFLPTIKREVLATNPSKKFSTTLLKTLVENCNFYRAEREKLHISTGNM
jgi:hypothetical protein